MFTKRFLSAGALLVFVLTTGWSTAKGQVEMSGLRDEGIPVFHYDVVGLASPVDTSLSRANIYVKVAYDELSFVKVDTGYQARYELSIVLFDSHGDQAAGKIIERKVFVKDYDQTNSRTDFDMARASFDLKPAEYRLSIGLMDLETRKTGSRKTKFVLRDFMHKPLAVSDVTLATSVESDSLGIRSYSPEVSDAQQGVRKNLLAYYEIYNHKGSDSVQVEYVVRNAHNEKVSKGRLWKQTPGVRTKAVLDLHSMKLQPGKYLLRLTVRDGHDRDFTEKMFNANWSGLPATISDLELAIDQLRYIATSEEFKALKKAPPEKKLKLFKEFWAKRDPTPGTPENEAMEEHYRRVQYANENFKGFQEGWKTDMGMVYIILGPPDDIERHPFEIDSKPYEIWYYYHINRQFIFVDENGFGEYRLYNPYELWDWQRLQR